MFVCTIVYYLGRTSLGFLRFAAIFSPLIILANYRKSVSWIAIIRNCRISYFCYLSLDETEGIYAVSAKISPALASSRLDIWRKLIANLTPVAHGKVESGLVCIHIVRPEVDNANSAHAADDKVEGGRACNRKCSLGRWVSCLRISLIKKQIWWFKLRAMLLVKSGAIRALRRCGCW